MGAMDFVILQAIQQMGAGSDGPGSPLLAPFAPSNNYLPMDGRVVTRASVPDYAALIPPAVKLSQTPAPLASSILGVNLLRGTLGTKHLIVDRTAGYAWDQPTAGPSGFAWGTNPNAFEANITPGPTGACGLIGTGHVVITYDNGATLYTTVLPYNHTRLVWIDSPGCWVAYGVDYKTISISYDGLAWSHYTVVHSALTAGTMWGVSYLNGTWCVVVNATPYISTDLGTWTQLPGLGTNASPSNSARIITVGGMAMAFADTSSYVYPLRTTDFKAWVYCKPPSTTIPLASSTITYQNGKFIISAASGGLVYSTVDGNAWTSGTLPVTGAAPSIGYYGGFYYSSIWGSYARSTDLITWTTVPPPFGYPTGALVQLVGTGSALVAYHDVGFSSTTDFNTWTPRAQLIRNGINLAAANVQVLNGTLFISAGTGYLATSDGWNIRCQGSTFAPMAADGTSTICGASGTYLGYSTDGGITWTRSSYVSTQIVNAMAYGGGVWVAVCGSGVILRSTDNGATWAPVTSNVAGNISGIVYANGTFVAWGAAGLMTTSPDGTTWTSRTTGVTQAITKVVWADTLALWVFTCYNSGTSTVIATSPDLGVWTSRQTAANPAMTVVWQNATLVVVGSNGLGYRSTNGTAWSALTGLTGQFNKVAWSSTLGAWIAPANTTQAYFTSPDASTWTSRNTWTGMATQGYAVHPFTTAWGDVLMWSGRGVMGVPTSPLSSMNAWNLLPAGVTDLAVSDTAAVVVTSGGSIYHRTTTTPWVPAAGTLPAFTQVVWDGTRFLAFCGTGAVYTSTTGASGTWGAGTSGTTNAVIGAASYNGVTVLFTSGRELRYTLNGTDWLDAAPPSGSSFSGLAVVDGVFFALGTINGSTLLLRSSDGSSWVQSYLTLPGSLSYACKLGSWFVLFGVISGKPTALVSVDNTFTTYYSSTVLNTEFKRTLSEVAGGTTLTGVYGAVLLRVTLSPDDVALPTVASPISGMTYYIRVAA